MTRRGSRIVSSVAALALTAAAWWAFKPLPTPDFTMPALSNASPFLAPVQLAALDTGVFSTPLWVAPPAPPAAPTPPPPPPPLPAFKLQLIAIVRDGSDPDAPRSVLMYDPDADRLVTLRPGDQIAGRRIERITQNSVEIREGTDRGVWGDWGGREGCGGGAAVKVMALVEPAAPLPRLGLGSGGKR